MSLVELVEALVRDIDLTTKDKSDANEKAEKLAEKYGFTGFPHFIMKKKFQTETLPKTS
jgi:thioredoxin-related protein